MKMGMERKEKRERERIEAVLEILGKQAPLTLKQEKFCNDACVERFLKAKGDNVKRVAKHLRAVLVWRESIGTEHLIADEFSAELAEGVAYVAGHDDESRPVVVFRIKQDYLKIHSQKSYVRLLVFTLEVAISSMSRFVDQFVLLFDASFFRSASVLLNVFMATMKIISDYYPGRLHKAFVIDAPSLFPYLWKVTTLSNKALIVFPWGLLFFELIVLDGGTCKGARPFVELSTATALVSSLDYEDSLEDETFASYPRTSSLRFDYHHVPLTTTRAIGSTSSRFSFTVSHMDAMKPWYLNTLSDSPTTTNTTSTTASPSLVGVSPLNARSYSFASPAGRSTPRGKSIPSTPSSAAVPPPSRQPRTPRPSFLQSPAMLFSFKKDNGAQGSKAERGRESFLPFLRFYRRPYSEMVYRAKMRPPLAGLVSIVSQQVKQRRHVYHQQRF